MSVIDHLQKKGVQACLIATSDMRLVKSSLQARKGYVEDVQRETNEAWGMSHNTLFRKADTLEEWLILFEGEAAPGSFDGKDKKHRAEFKERISTIAETAMDAELFLLQKRLAKDKQAEALKFIGIIAAILVVVAALVLMFLSGKVSL